MSFFSKFLTPVSHPSNEETTPPEKQAANPSLPCITGSVKHTPDRSDSNVGEDNTCISLSPVSPESEELRIEKPLLPPQAEHDAPHTAVAESIAADDEFFCEEPLSATVESYFMSKGFAADFSSSRDAVAPIESLAFSIAVDYPHTKAFIRFLRECITKKSFEFTYVLTPFDTFYRNAIIALAEKLSEHGLISDYFLVKPSSVIKGTVSSAPRAINFLNGDFMEMYAKCVTVGVIKKSAEKFGCDYELFHNVKIEKNGEKHELDMVFRLGRHVFWSEVKSGKFNPDEYRKLGEFLGVVPDKFIMLAADKSNDASVSISYFYEYYCANINTFKASLIEMINKAFNEEVINND